MNKASGAVMQHMTALYKTKMKYIIKMADISILADVPYFLHGSRSTSNFIYPESNGIEEDLRINIVPVNELPHIENIRHTESKRIYVGEGNSAGTFFLSHPNRPPYAFVSRRTAKDGYLCCEYLPGNEEYMNYARNLITFVDIEATLLDFDALILHASLIRWKDKGIIFSAPPGTGKSTQAELWKHYEEAEILNGDRAALRNRDKAWRAYGLPFAGSSGIYRNESAPLRAIVALRQAEENRIRLISGAEAFRYLYPETLIHRWDREFEEKATGLLLSLMNEVPVYLLECRPDHEAVELLKAEILSLKCED